MDNFELGDGDELTVSIPMEDGTELECDVILIFELDEQDYVALTPTDEDSEDLYLLRCSYDGSDSMELEEIEDDEEFDNVLEAYNAIMEEEEWNDLLGEDD